jgi:hypothetical protein
MLICMRTTVIIEDQLLIQAKREAANRGLSLSDLINEALRRALAPCVVEARRFHMTTFGDPRAPVHHEPGDFAAALEADEHPRSR